MAREPMQDMIPPEKRTIRRIHIDRAKRTRVSREPDVEETSPDADTTVQDVYVGPPEPPQNHLPPEPPLIPSRKRAWWKWIAGVVIILVIFVLALSFLFSGARVEAVPRQEGVFVDGQFTAHRNAEPGNLGFEVMSFTKTLGQEVTATGEEFVDQKASGTITVYNDFDENDQRLIKNTRFETPEGLIYRIPESIVVPGQETNADGETVPGSVEVTVFADTSGEEYNIGPTDFTIPGFEGDPRFEKFYARSKTPMQGGFAGLQKTVSSADEASARTALERELTEAVRTEASAQVPSGYLLYDEASFITFRSLPNEPTEDDAVVNVREEAAFYGIILKSEDLARHVATQVVASYDGQPVEILGAEELDFSIVDRDLIEPVSLETFDFVLSGSGALVWTFDEERLKSDFAGKHRRDVETVLSAYPAIERAEITLRPFWKRYFPEDASKIKVERIIERAL